MSAGRCYTEDHDPELWFPEEAANGKWAKEICADCPVRIACLDWALEHDVPYGIFGGLSERQRGRIKRGTSVRV